MSSRKKKQSPSNPAPANRLASQSQQTQQSQPLSPWSAHTPISGKWPSPFSRDSSALSTTATAAGELFLFGGIAQKCFWKRISNDQYVVSTRDFSTTLLRISGDVPKPRYGHCAVLTSNTFFIWGGISSFTNKIKPNEALDNSLYLLNLVLRRWTRIIVNGPGPCGRLYHTMTLVGSKLFVFGGWANERCFNDIWALDLNCLESNPFWESYDPAPGNEKPLPRSGHVSVTTGDRIIVFGGVRQHFLNDTWSFNISTRKWTELQCTGSIPSPRAYHAAVLVDGVMYVFGGVAPDETKLNDLTAFNLSTQRWIAFRYTAPSPSGRSAHTMACDGTRVFVLGGILSQDAHADETKIIHVLDIKRLVYPEPDSDAVNPNAKTTQPVRKSLASPSTREQPHQRSSSSSDTHAAHGTSPFQKATPEEPSETLVSKTERDWRQLTDELALKSALLEQAEENAADEKKRAGRELRKLQAKFDELLLSHEQAEANAAEEKRRVGLELRKLQAKFDELLLSHEQAKANAEEEKERAGLELRDLQARFDESLLSRDHALEQVQSALQKASCAAEANEHSQRELTDIRVELEASKSKSAAFRLRLADTENGGAENEAEADTYRTQSATGLVNTNEDRVVHSLMERMQAMEAEMATLRRNEKSFEMMECRNEG